MESAAIDQERKEELRRRRLGRDNVRHVFRERMEREGRLEAFVARVLEIERETGKPGYYKAMKEFGYVSPQRERKLHHEAKAIARANYYVQKIGKTQRKRKRQMQQLPLNEAFDKLPNSAPVEAEMAWVKAHPKVGEALDRMDDDDADPIRLTAHDITATSNGPAPSKGAVNMLRMALRDPVGWHKALLSESKKKVSGNQGDDADDGHVNDDLSEVDRILRAALGG